MGREIRMVPPNWEHPKDEHGRLIPLYSRTFADAAAEWKREFAEWESGKRPDYCTSEESRAMEFWEWSSGPPENREDYRPYADAEATWVQMYETVTEGTPVTPPFATREELARHLAEHGTAWDKEPWGQQRADAFVRAGWAPSGMYTPETGFLESKDFALAMERENS